MKRFKLKYRTGLIMIFSIMVSVFVGYYAYQWAIRPSQVTMYCPWREEWNASGLKWAKDCYGPVILQKTRLSDRWWSQPLSQEQQWQLRDVWLEHETRYRLSLLYFLVWTGFMSTFFLWFRERGRVRHQQ